MGLLHQINYYDIVKILFFMTILSGIIALPNPYSKTTFALSSQGSNNEQGKNSPEVHRTAISLSSPDSVVSGTSITIMGKLIDTDADPPTEIPNKQLRFTGSGVTQYWKPVTTGGFIVNDPSGTIEMESCTTCEPDSGTGSGNKFMSLNLGSEIVLPNGTRGIKLSFLNENATHYDILVTRSGTSQNTTLVSEESQLLNNTRSNLAILFPEGISKVSLMRNSHTSGESQVGILKLQTFDPAGDPENQTTIDFESFAAPSELQSPLVLNPGLFVSTNVAVDKSPGPFNVSVSFLGDQKYLPSSNVTEYRTIGSSFGAAGETGAVVTDYIGTVWTSLSNVCGTGPDADADGICDSWENNSPPNTSNQKFITCPLTSGGSFMDPLCTSSSEKYNLCFTDAFSDVWGGAPNQTICPKDGHKDIFVEIDYMAGPNVGPPSTDAIKKVIKAFGNAPGITGTADAFGRTQGITLHVVVDESLTWVQQLNIWQDPTSGCGPGDDCNNNNDFRHIKEGTTAINTDGHFGTSTEHVPGGAIQLNMKHYVYHYGIFADSIGAPCGPSGIAEVRGNDFIVSLGCGFTEPAGSPDEQAGTFMHELGHNLNLDHGGSRSTSPPVNSTNYGMNCKPNYLSVMNYARQVPITPTATIWEGNPATGLKSFLDYSSHGYFSMPGWSIFDLREGAPLSSPFLDERAGLVTQDKQMTVYGNPADSLNPIKISATRLSADPPYPTYPGINWNGIDGMEATTVSQDVNWLNTPSFSVAGGCQSSPGELEKGINDWLLLSLKFLFDTDSRDGIGSDPRKLPELTSEILKDLKARVNQFVGPDSPINATGSSVFNLNTTIPVRFHLRDVNGSFINNASVSFFAKKISNNITGTNLEKVNTTFVPSSGNLFKYNNTSNQYSFNWFPGNLTQGEYALRFIANANSPNSTVLQGIGENGITVKVGLKQP